MKTLRTTEFRRAILASAAVFALLPNVALAQSNAAEEPEGDGSEIVVTGTILRGAAPVGSNAITVGQEKIAETGATTANELLTSVPQVTNLFNNVPQSRLGVAVNQIQVVRPNLRNLAGETSSSSSTLVMFDGRRIAPVGVTQNAIDPDILPPIAIERVEVVTDGGSATYGSDAVGGVINFITRKRFDGLKVQAHYGFADNYKQYDAAAILGKDWGSGSAYVAYSYQHNDPLFARDRDFIKDVDWLSPNLTPRGRSCTPGNVRIGSAAFFALPGLTSTTPNSCDYRNNSVVPESTRHSGLARLHQELSPWLTVDLGAFYGERKSVSSSDYAGSVTVTGSPLQFYYLPVPGQSATASQTVFFNLNSVLGASSNQSRSSFKEWGANAEFQADLGGGWQMRTLFNYSNSDSEYHIGGFNSTLLTNFGRGTTAATAINFYNPSAADIANIQQLINTESAGQGREELFNLRAIVDGTLFTLPGGDVKVAAGYEFARDNFRQRIVAANLAVGALAGTRFVPYGRSVNSFFGEVQAPVIEQVTLSASVRHDRFSDFGNTTNPKFGISIKPVSWLNLRGNYSTSFNAPSPVDQLGVFTNTLFAFPFNAFVPAGVTPVANGVVALQGSNPGLLPQTAKTWSVGFDMDPLEGVHVSASYYNVKFKDIIGTPAPNATIFALNPNNVIANVNGVPLATITSFINASGLSSAAATLASVTAGCATPANCLNVYELVDFRKGNIGSVNVDGIDFVASYRGKTGFGGFDFGVSGNYALNRKSQAGVGAPIVNELIATNIFVQPGNVSLQRNGSSRLQLQATAGIDVGSFRAQATLNHSAGYATYRCDATSTPVCNATTNGNPSGSGQPQDRVGAFNTVNLFFKYDVPAESGLLRDLQFTLNVNNVLDTDPPVLRAIGQSGYANGFTLGRLIQFGVAKKF
ncbi:TonB-dependent receptor plug domain-containing protein [Novosphingobium aquae]|uniref:TonB-dependent receptor n=1 Tax=Novosphingobium aquae TaxID=3133435 RepID=A0ABU8S9E5_9SPHN